MQKLDEMKIPFSAVECKNESIAITVSRDDESAFRSVEKQFKAEHSRKFVNPEFFKSLPIEFGQRLVVQDMDRHRLLQDRCGDQLHHPRVVAQRMDPEEL